MSEKGILIDVGFKAELKEFINSVETELSNVDFSNKLGLTEAFDSQIKDAKKKLEGLKQEIDRTINGKLPNDPVKQIKELNDAVVILSSTMRDVIKSMPESQTKGFGQQIESLNKYVNDLTNTCENAVDTVSELGNISKNGKISFIDSSAIDDLKEYYKMLEKARRATDSFDTPKKNGNRKYLMIRLFIQ